MLIREKDAGPKLNGQSGARWGISQHAQGNPFSFCSLKGTARDRASNCLGPIHGIRPVVGKPLHGPLVGARRHVGLAISNALERGPTLQDNC